MPLLCSLIPQDGIEQNGFPNLVADPQRQSAALSSSKRYASKDRQHDTEFTDVVPGRHHPGCGTGPTCPLASPTPATQADPRHAPRTIHQILDKELTIFPHRALLQSLQ
jgi:hypothetical protein